MSREQVDRMIDYDRVTPNKRGKWLAFCLREGVTRNSVYHWRCKLGLKVRQKR